MLDKIRKTMYFYPWWSTPQTHQKLSEYVCEESTEIVWKRVNHLEEDCMLKTLKKLLKKDFLRIHGLCHWALCCVDAGGATKMLFGSGTRLTVETSEFWHEPPCFWWILVFLSVGLLIDIVWSKKISEYFVVLECFCWRKAPIGEKPETVEALVCLSMLM